MVTNRASEFIELYNRLAVHLVSLTGMTHEAGFSTLVVRAREKSRVVAYAADQLRDYAELRNAIVHHRAYPREIIAEPTEETIARFRQIVDQVCNPRRLGHLLTNVREFRPEESLIVALRYMRENDFSQVVVRDGGRLALLTVEGVARWLEEQAEIGLADLASATVASALACDLRDTFVVLGREATVFDARAAFDDALNQLHPRLFAVIITHSGRGTERPLGIVTPWDVIREQIG